MSLAGENAVLARRNGTARTRRQCICNLQRQVLSTTATALTYKRLDHIQKILFPFLEQLLDWVCGGMSQRGNS